MLGMSANSVSYNDQGGSVESGVDAAQENSNIQASISGGAAAFSLFSADYKKSKWRTCSKEPTPQPYGTKAEEEDDD